MTRPISPRALVSPFFKSVINSYEFETYTEYQVEYVGSLVYGVVRSRSMERFWTLITFLHSLAGPALTLLYPLYASVMAIESTSKLDDQQWLAYWILYSFLTLMEMVLQPVLQWIPIWYDMKLALVAWLVLPQFRGASLIYIKFVREKLINKYAPKKSLNGNKF